MKIQIDITQIAKEALLRNNSNICPNSWDHILIDTLERQHNFLTLVQSALADLIQPEDEQ